MNASPLPRKRVPCRCCGRGVLMAPYLGRYPVFIRCAACYRDGSTAVQPIPWRNAA
jgi:hypothetical protein